MVDNVVVKASGRINLIGEHVDYNGGFVLPASIDKKTIIDLNSIQGEECFIESETIKKEFKINILKLHKSEIHWENYIIGAMHNITILKKLKIGAFRCKISGNLPIGSGVSSSSALICGFVTGLNYLFKLGLSTNTILEIVSEVEQKFIGLRGGIMDQFTILNGKKDKLILLNCQDKSLKYVHSNFNNYKLLLLNTNVKHNLANTAYNDRVDECKMALNIIRKKYKKYNYLTQVEEDTLNQFKSIMSKKIYSRALFVIQENKRTLKSVKKIEESKLLDLGKLMYQSHEGLKNLYQVSCDELDYLVDFTLQFEQIIGARMMGGGFGGCTINLIDESFVDDFVQLVSKNYEKKFNIKLNPSIVKIEDGIIINDR